MNSNEQYFHDEQLYGTPKFFGRFPKQLIKDLQGKTSLDLGCGHGAMSIFCAQNGAQNVVGIDLNSDVISFAIENLTNYNADIVKSVQFICQDLSTLCLNQFDYIITKSSFEHILDLQSLLPMLKSNLKLGGKIVTGFGPLYNSPYGDHFRLRPKAIFLKYIPWCHLLLPNDYMFRQLNKNNYGERVTTLDQLGLNGLSLSEYIEMFNSTEGLTVIDFRTNVVHSSTNLKNKIVNSILQIISKNKLITEYFTHNIFCVIERTN